MLFINPKIDFAFKKIFGSKDSKDILISFLNALIYEAQPVIHDLEICKKPMRLPEKCWVFWMTKRSQK
jgi:predicted transposase/invertase (TIGR01784 family)